MVKKINIKKLFLIFMLIILAFVFCGCATIQASVISNEDGTIDEIVTIKLNEETMQSTSILEIKTDIQKVANEEANEIVSEYNTKWQIELIYADSDEKVAKLNSIKNGADVVTSKWSEDTFAIGVRFKNIDAYKFYHNRTEETSITFEKQEHFFYTKNYYYARNIYTTDLVLFNKMNAYFTTKYNGVVDVENVNIHYTYITESRREHSDADYIEKIDGKYYHTWVVDQENLEEPIMFYYNVANMGNCILLCVGIDLIVAIILLIVAIIKKKIKLKNNKNN